MDKQADGSDGRKSPSTIADVVGTGGRHGVRLGQNENNGGRREFEGAEPSGEGGNYGGREASGVDPKTH